MNMKRKALLLFTNLLIILACSKNENQHVKESQILLKSELILNRNEEIVYLYDKNNKYTGAIFYDERKKE